MRIHQNLVLVCKHILPVRIFKTLFSTLHIKLEYFKINQAIFGQSGFVFDARKKHPMFSNNQIGTL